MPIERQPSRPVHMIGRWPPPDHHKGYPYRVLDTDNWWSVARKFGIDVWKLIEYNFNTRNPDEVNWYLRTLVGCKTSTPDGLNYTFRGATPGVIFIPPGFIKRVNVPAPQSSASPPGSRRNPTAAEQRLYWQVFRDTLPDPYRIHIVDSLGVSNSAFVRPDLWAFPPEWVLHIGPTAYKDCTRKIRHEIGAPVDQTFIHELTHVWQAHNTVLTNVALLSALCTQVKSSLTGSNPYKYTPGKNWSEYDREQQAQIVEDWYGNGMKTSDPLYQYIENHIRKRRD